MTTRAELLNYLNSLLQPEMFQDYAPNGLQVQGREKIERVAAATSASLPVIRRAAGSADALLVHHGWFWKNERIVVTGGLHEKLSLSLSHELNLFAYHLPLDALENFGNNQPVLTKLGCRDLSPFLGICWGGEFRSPLRFADLKAKLEVIYGCDPVCVPVSESCRKVFICSGAGADLFRELCLAKAGLHPDAAFRAWAADADAFISGEGTEWVYSLAQEHGISYLAVGHNRSERIGPDLLGRHLAEKFSLEFVFLEEENPF